MDVANPRSPVPLQETPVAKIRLLLIGTRRVPVCGPASMRILLISVCTAVVPLLSAQILAFISEQVIEISQTRPKDFLELSYAAV